MEKQFLMEKFKALTLAQIDHAKEHIYETNMFEPIRENMLFILRNEQRFLDDQSEEHKHVDEISCSPKFVSKYKIISNLRAWWLMWKTDEDFGWMTDILVPCLVAAITTLIVSRLIFL